MPDPRDLQLSSYDYPLPPERIAQAPVEPRHSARLLMVPPQGEPSMDAAHGQAVSYTHLTLPTKNEV